MPERSVGLHFFEQVVEELNRRLSGIEDGYIRLLEDNQRLSKEVVALKQALSQPGTKIQSQITTESEPPPCEEVPAPLKKEDFLGEKVVKIISGKVQSVCDDYIKLRDSNGTQMIPSEPFKSSDGYNELSQWHNYVTLTQYQNSPPTIEFNRYH